MKQSIRAATVIGMFVAAASGQARADFVLSGPDSNAGSYSTSSLASIANLGDTVSADGFTGVSLWGLLGGANAANSSPVYGDITTSTPAGDNSKNAILRYYLLGTGAEGERSVISLGEIDPNFGGTATPPAFVAFQTIGGALLTVPELIVPGISGRGLTNLTSLQLLAVPALSGAPTAPGGESTSVTLAGVVNNPGSYTLTSLQNNFLAVQENISGSTYTGVPLWNFLDPSDPNTTSQIVITQATDGYEVVLSLAELDPALGGNSGDLLPYDGPGFPGVGVARTIFPGDNAHGRWESNLDVVTLVDVFEPGTLTLLPMALVSLAMVRRRRCNAPTA